MTSIDEQIKVDSKTKNWLRNGGKNLIDRTVKEITPDLKERKLLFGDFYLDLTLDGSDVSDQEARERLTDMGFIPGDHPECYRGEPVSEEEEKKMIEEIKKNWIPEDMVDFSADWHGSHGAAVIFDTIQRLCEYNGVRLLEHDKINNAGISIIDKHRNTTVTSSARCNATIEFSYYESFLMTKALNETHVDAFDTLRDYDMTLFERKCVCCLSSDIKTKIFLERIDDAIRIVDKKQYWNNKELALDSLNKLRNFVSETKSPILQIEDARLDNRTFDTRGARLMTYDSDDKMSESGHKITPEIEEMLKDWMSKNGDQLQEVLEETEDLIYDRMNSKKWSLDTLLDSLYDTILFILSKKDCDSIAEGMKDWIEEKGDALGDWADENGELLLDTLEEINDFLCDNIESKDWSENTDFGYVHDIILFILSKRGYADDYDHNIEKAKDPEKEI